MEKYIVLPFSKPIINHIPTDASRLSILAAQNQVLPIVHNFMNIFAFSIKTNEDIIFWIHNFIGILMK